MMTNEGRVYFTCITSSPMGHILRIDKVVDCNKNIINITEIDNLSGYNHSINLAENDPCLSEGESDCYSFRY